MSPLVVTGAGACQGGPDVPAESVLSQYRGGIARAGAVAAATPLDATPLDAAPARWTTERFRDRQTHEPRRTLLSVTSGVAVNAGHLGIVREPIKGRAWLSLR